MGRKRAAGAVAAPQLETAERRYDLRGNRLQQEQAGASSAAAPTTQGGPTIRCSFTAEPGYLTQLDDWFDTAVAELAVIIRRDSLQPGCTISIRPGTPHWTARRRTGPDYVVTLSGLNYEQARLKEIAMAISEMFAEQKRLHRPIPHEFILQIEIL